MKYGIISLLLYYYISKFHAQTRECPLLRNATTRLARAQNVLLPGKTSCQRLLRPGHCTRPFMTPTWQLKGPTELSMGPQRSTQQRRLFRTKSGDGTAVGMVKLKELATAPMAQEKRISEQEGQQEVPDYLRSGWAAVPHQSHAQRRLEHKRLRNVRQPQQHFVASPMDKLMSPQTSIGKTRPIVYMSASVGTAIEAISPKRLRQRNVQSKTKTVGRPAWPLPGKERAKNLCLDIKGRKNRFSESVR